MTGKAVAGPYLNQKRSSGRITAKPEIIQIGQFLAYFRVEDDPTAMRETGSTIWQASQFEGHQIARQSERDRVDRREP